MQSHQRHYFPFVNFLRPGVSQVLAGVLIAGSTSARASGHEPVFIQIKQSIRLDANYGAQLQDLATLENSLGLTVEKRWINPRVFIEMISFPVDSSTEQDFDASAQLQQSPAVEKLVTQAAFNLVFQPGDFSGEYGPDDPVSEIVLRGLDTPPAPAIDPAALNQPHVSNQLIVAWKPEYIWNSAQTGFLQTIAQFNAANGCRAISSTFYSATDLTQVLEFEPNNVSLLELLQRYANSGFVRYAEPNFYVFSFGDPPLTPRKHARAKRRMHSAMDGPKQ